jgi:dipeptidyl aminopeptidase/acylaminoacyl peptidase
MPPRLFGFLLLLALAAGVGAEPITAADIARRGQLYHPLLSPDGERLAITVLDKDGRNDAWRLAIYRLADKQVTFWLSMPRNEMPANYLWVDDKRLVIARARAGGSREEPELTGEILAIDVDGKNQIDLYGPRHKDILHMGAGLLAGVPEPRNGHVFVRTLSHDGARTLLLDIDSRGDAIRLVAGVDGPGMTFALQHDGKVRYAYGANAQNVFETWQCVATNKCDKLDLGTATARFMPIAFSADNREVFAYYGADGGPLTLVRQPVAGGERALLAADPLADVGRLQWTAAGQPFAASVGGGVPRVLYLDEQADEAQLHRALAEKFPGSQLELLGTSADKLLFGVSSDRDPGTYYVFDPQTRKMRKMFERMPWIDPQKMAERRPIRFSASDGMQLAGFLTLPTDREARNLPMVLLPHGGPHGIEDTWFFDEDAQFLASRGYAVLQVNYRGSGGRGVNFQEAGYRQWGTRIQDDLLDGVRWTIAQGVADGKRVCAYGASFGGYSAMMTAIRAPDLFKCAVGYAGVYDLAMMYTKGDIRRRDFGRSYLDDVIGMDPAELRANSPVALVEQLKAPVLIVHGEADPRAPFDQAKALRRALDKAHKPYEWFTVPREGHGFYTEEHRRQFYEKLEAFLASHLAP